MEQESYRFILLNLQWRHLQVDVIFVQACHEIVRNVDKIVKCKCAILKEQQEHDKKSKWINK